MEREISTLKNGNRLTLEFLRGHGVELRRRAKEAIIVYERCGCNQCRTRALEEAEKAIEFDNEQQFLKTGVILKESEKGVEYSARWLLEQKRKERKKGKK
jgi:hypothetical protein